MHDLAIKQVGHRGETDVGVRPNVDTARNPALQRFGTQVIEENERPDHPPPWKRQHPAHFEAAEVAAALIDHHIQHGLPALETARGRRVATALVAG